MRPNTVHRLLLLFALVYLGLVFVRALQRHSAFWIDALVGAALILGFTILRRRLHQDLASHTALTFAVLLHSSGLYGTHPFGIEFDMFMHTIGGATIALIADRFLVERLPAGKRILLLILLALGVGAVGEMIEFAGAHTLGSGDGFFLFGVGDENAWTDTIQDMACNLFGASLMAFSLAQWRKAYHRHSYKA